MEKKYQISNYIWGVFDWETGKFVSAHPTRREAQDEAASAYFTAFGRVENEANKVKKLKVKIEN